jgi:hypothetical protein
MNDQLITQPPWIEKIDLSELARLAGIGLPPEKVAIYFKIPEDDFMYWFMQDGSQLKYEYDRGVIFYSAKEAQQMMKDSMDGNTTQGQRLDKMREQVNFQHLKETIIYGKE